MKKAKPIVLLLALFMMLSALSCGSVLAAPEPAVRDWDTLAPNGTLISDAVNSESAILINGRTGEVLYAKDVDEKQYPASITKIMTCLIALENGSLTDTITVTDVPVLESGAVTIGVKVGEVYTLEQLLYGLMLPSGNDAAAVIAVHFGGSIEGFADMMNAKAQELGMTNSHFITPNGLHDDDHYVTATDMAKLAFAAMQNESFRKIVSTYSYTCAATNMNDKTRTWKNTNHLISPDDDDIYAYGPATGIKTGFTSDAGHTLVSSASKDNTDLIAVMLHSTVNNKKWTDSITMFEYGFAFYSTVDVSSQLSSRTESITVANACTTDEESGQLVASPQINNAIYVTDKKDIANELLNNCDPITGSVQWNDNLSAPIQTGDIVGTVTYSYHDYSIATCDLVATQDIAVSQEETQPTQTDTVNPVSGESMIPGDFQPGTSGLSAFTKKALIVLGIIFLILVLAVFIIRSINIARRRARRRQQRLYRGYDRRRR